MDPNSIQNLAGLAYIHKLDSQSSDWEYEEPEPIIQLGWALRLVGRLLSALGSGLTSIGGWLKQRQDLPIDATLRRHEGS